MVVHRSMPPAGKCNDGLKTMFHKNTTSNKPHFLV